MVFIDLSTVFAELFKSSILIFLGSYLGTVYSICRLSYYSRYLLISETNNDGAFIETSIISLTCPFETINGSVKFIYISMNLSSHDIRSKKNSIFSSWSLRWIKVKFMISLATLIWSKAIRDLLCEHSLLPAFALGFAHDVLF